MPKLTIDYTTNNIKNGGININYIFWEMYVKFHFQNFAIFAKNSLLFNLDEICKDLTKQTDEQIILSHAYYKCRVCTNKFFFYFVEMFAKSLPFPKIRCFKKSMDIPFWTENLFWVEVCTVKHDTLRLARLISVLR